jgi:BirA family biotin operon repressor/biotin-[acetyl-CoA-carboxylase] ligase
MSDTSLRQLLGCLSDGQVHSGEALGIQLGVSRAAVWKQVKQAQALGLPVQAQKGMGYRLPAAMALLDAGKISAQLQASVRAAVPVINVLFQVDSTNNDALRRLRAGEETPFLIVAEMQSAGRGRRGRHWYSPFGGSIYMTLGWRFTQGLAALEGLSLVVGLMLLRSLQKSGAGGLALKWPNDVMWQQQKLAGILVDVQGDPAGDCQVAIGVGLNVHVPVVPDDQHQASIEQPWVDLQTVLQSSHQPLPDRNVLAAGLLNELVPALLTMEDSGFARYQDEWQQHDYCFGKPLQVSQGFERISGRGTGVNRQGAYRMDTPQGEWVVSGGEISLQVEKVSV